ncbi:MAG: sulfatase family protein [Gemmataceae bacterium]
MRQQAIALMVAALTSGLARAETPRRPNVLWICADDHAPYVCGAYGNKIVRTPNLDCLAAEGVRFDRAYCNSPVCTASRQSFLTGRYPRTLGVTLLKTALPEGEPTLATRLRAAGYDTAAIGKMHFNSNLRHGFDLRIDVPQHNLYRKQHPAKPLPPDIKVLPAWRPFRDSARIWLNSAYLPFAARDEDMTGTFFAHQAADYLRQRRDKPFFLMVSFYEPHSPFRFPIEYRGKYRPEQFTVPKVGAEDDAQIPDIFRDLTAREKQGIVAAYYTSTEFMDKNVGLVLDALKRSGCAADTLVIYLGDHGYMLGQHGRFEKHCCYEPAVRSPLLLRWPQQIKARRNTKALVEFLDLAPTVFDFCGVPVPASVQGKSLKPLLRGEVQKHRERVVVEYSENEEAMIRTRRWKLIYSTGKRQRQDGYATGRPLPGRTIRLYDEENDPDETTNLAGKPEHARRVADLTSQLAEHLKRTARQPELIPKEGDVHAVLEFCLQPRDVKAAKK